MTGVYWKKEIHQILNAKHDNRPGIDKWPVYRLFGLTMASNFPFRNRLAKGVESPDLRFTCTEKAPADSWKRSLPVFNSSGRTEDGQSILSIYHLTDYDLLHFTDVADFYLWPGRIICHLLNPNYDYLVEIRLLGTVLSYWLERSGIPALHAAAVVPEGGAIAFLAGHNGGKSSLAACFMQKGNPLLTDDILPVEYIGGNFIGRPGYPQMRLWPEEARYFLGGYRDLEQVHPLYSKRRVRVDSPGGLGTFCDLSQPLAGLYFLERRKPEEEAIEIAPISPGAAVIELVRNSFSAQIVEAMQLRPQRLGIFARMVKKLPMRRVRYPSGFEHLLRVRQAILDDLINHAN